MVPTRECALPTLERPLMVPTLERGNHGLAVGCK